MTKHRFTLHLSATFFTTRSEDTTFSGGDQSVYDLARSHFPDVLGGLIRAQPTDSTWPKYACSNTSLCLVPPLGVDSIKHHPPGFTFIASNTLHSIALPRWIKISHQTLIRFLSGSIWRHRQVRNVILRQKYLHLPSYLTPNSPNPSLTYRHHHDRQHIYPHTHNSYTIPPTSPQSLNTNHTFWPTLRTTVFRSGELIPGVF